MHYFGTVFKEPAIMSMELPAAQVLYQRLLADVGARYQAAADRPLHMVGVASGGALLAQHLQRDLAVQLAQPMAPVGVISSAMHRDDFAVRGLSGSQATHLPFDVNGAHLLLIDDVLYTGRTIRAVLNELFDYGRPASVRLLVLVDRGGRQLPIAADFAAQHCQLPADHRLFLGQDAHQQLTLVQGLTGQRKDLLA
jgi:pyrimidine operon attenuation protein / uracil phosphoribosyltransferase